MMPGPNIIYKCPKCGNLIRNCSISSGNTFDAIRYSDGKVIAPMMPQYPAITKCQKCNEIFWLDEELEVGTYYEHESKQHQSEWLKADEASYLSMLDYANLLNSKNKELIRDEYLIRLLLWWHFNDRVRANEEMFNSNEEILIWKDNLVRLLDILDIDEIQDRITAAEIYRSIGRFSKSKSLLKSITDVQFQPVKKLISDACDIKSTKVFKISG